MNRWLVLLITFCLACVNACGSADEFTDDSFESSYSISAEDALEISLKFGVEKEKIIYFDMVPHDLDSDGMWESGWAIVEETDDQLLTTWIDPWNGEVLDITAPHEGLRAHIQDLRSVNNLSLMATSPNTYNSEPWGDRLPLGESSTLTCGYGCGEHTGSIYYSVDLALPKGRPVYSAHSAYVMYASDSRNTCKTQTTGYGCYVILQGADAGSGKRYLTRYAHLDGIDAKLVQPGWWFDIGRYFATVGSSGYSTGPHVHFEWRRGTFSNGSISGDTLPITNWPNSSAGFCNGGFNPYNFFGTPQKVLNLKSNGCL